MRIAVSYNIVDTNHVAVGSKRDLDLSNNATVKDFNEEVLRKEPALWRFTSVWQIKDKNRSVLDSAAPVQNGDNLLVFIEVERLRIIKSLLGNLPSARLSKCLLPTTRKSISLSFL